MNKLIEELNSMYEDEESNLNESNEIDKHEELVEKLRALDGKRS
jgi:hypothetical protein